MRVGLLGFVLLVGAPIASTGCTFLAPSDSELYGVHPDAGGLGHDGCPDWCTFDAGANFIQVTFEKGLTDSETGATSASNSGSDTRPMWVGGDQTLHCTHSAEIFPTKKTFLGIDVSRLADKSAKDLYVSFYVKLTHPTAGKEQFVTFATELPNDVVLTIDDSSIGLKNGRPPTTLGGEEGFVGLHVPRDASKMVEFVVRKSSCVGGDVPETKTIDSSAFWSADLQNLTVRIGNAGNDGTIGAIIDDIRISTKGFEQF